MVKVYHQGKDITEIVTSITWSGDYKQAARRLEFGIAVHPHDAYLPRITLKMGDMVALIDDKGKELFQGYVFYKEKSINGNEMQVTAYDRLIYLLKSKGTYNFKNMTPQAITSKVCSDFGIPIGRLADGRSLNRLFDAENIYNIIMTVYTIESNKSGRLYMPRMEKRKLNVIEKGSTITKFILEPETTIINSTYSESIENSINKVKMYNENGKYIGEVTLPGIPGTLQDIYKKEKGHDAQAQAKGMLKGMERTAEIEAIGDVECITGNAVVIKEPYTGLSGLFYIDNDEHTFSNGQHTMKLGLSFKNMMDSQDSGETPENKKTSSKKSSGQKKDDNKSGYF